MNQPRQRRTDWRKYSSTARLALPSIPTIHLVRSLQRTHVACRSCNSPSLSPAFRSKLNLSQPRNDCNGLRGDVWQPFPPHAALSLPVISSGSSCQQVRPRIWCCFLRYWSKTRLKLIDTETDMITRGIYCIDPQRSSLRTKRVEEKTYGNLLINPTERTGFQLLKPPQRTRRDIFLLFLPANK